VIIPLPEAEQYRLGVQRKRRKVERDQQKARSGRLLPRLLEAGAVEVGQPLYFRRDAVPDNAPPWSETQPLYTATLVGGDGVSTLDWDDPDTGQSLRESPSLLAARLLHRLGLRSGEISSAGINGMHYWTIDGQTSLRDLAREVGLVEGSPRRIDRDQLRSACGQIPEGRWTTYGDLAAAVGVPGAAQSIANVIASDPKVPNAHRVLRASGQVAPAWHSDSGDGSADARARLEAEGVAFTDGQTADAARRWKPLTVYLPRINAGD